MFRAYEPFYPQISCHTVTLPTPFRSQHEQKQLILTVSWNLKVSRKSDFGKAETVIINIVPLEDDKEE